MRPDFPLARFIIPMVLSLAFVSSAAAADLSPREQIEESLMCHCGCSDLTVRVCTCGTAAAIRSDITARLANGEDKETILAAYVARYGEQILSAPTRKGFNLLAWIMPFAVLLIATTFLVIAIRRWQTSGRARAESRSEAFAPSELSDAQRRTLQRVEREFRGDV